MTVFVSLVSFVHRKGRGRVQLDTGTVGPRTNGTAEQESFYLTVFVSLVSFVSFVSFVPQTPWARAA